MGWEVSFEKSSQLAKARPTLVLLEKPSLHFISFIFQRIGLLEKKYGLIFCCHAMQRHLARCRTGQLHIHMHVHTPEGLLCHEHGFILLLTV